MFNPDFQVVKALLLCSGVHRRSRQHWELFFSWRSCRDHLQQLLNRAKEETSHLELLADALPLNPCFKRAARIRPGKDWLWVTGPLLRQLRISAATPGAWIKNCTFPHITHSVAGDSGNNQNNQSSPDSEALLFFYFLHLTSSAWDKQMLLLITISSFSSIKDLYM